jgi:hypothetical protein
MHHRIHLGGDFCYKNLTKSGICLRVFLEARISDVVTWKRRKLVSRRVYFILVAKGLQAKARRVYSKV